MKLEVKLLKEEYQQFYDSKKNYASDSGFDLYCVEDVTIEPWSVGTINSGVACSPRTTTPQGYYKYPRSSISKTPLMLANSVGIIDYTYRGPILSKVRNMSNQPYTVKKGTSLFQLCTPNLTPFEEIKFVSELDQTERGSGGFGSTN